MGMKTSCLFWPFPSGPGPDYMCVLSHIYALGVRIRILVNLVLLSGEVVCPLSPNDDLIDRWARRMPEYGHIPDLMMN